jgi:hypothetical protein
MQAMAALGWVTAVACGPVPPPDLGGGGPSTTDTPDAPPGPAPAVLPAFARLTTRQIRNAYVDLLGPVTQPALPADTTPYLFESIGAASEPLSESGVQLLEEAATALATQVFADRWRREAVAGCAPVAPGDACAASFVREFGRRAWRRPLRPEEVARWLAVATDFGADDPWAGLAAVTAGMLQSPWFLYRVELGVPVEGRPGVRRLTPYELATRLALFFWNTTPDAALLAAAGDGSLDTPEGLAEAVDRLQADPRAHEATEAFFSQYLDLQRLDRAKPDPSTYPDFTPALRDAMRAEVLLLVDEAVYRRDADVRGIFSARRAYVNDALADHYGLDAPGATPITFVPVDLPPDSPRAGILGLGAFLTMNAHAIDTSPTLRGKYILERVLCAKIPPPPGNVSLDLTTGADPDATLRDRLEQHREDPACSGCHSMMDPPGFLFESFDATGAWRTEDRGRPIDSSGKLYNVDLADAGELGDLLATHEDVGPCIVKQLFRHAHGRLDSLDDERALTELAAGFAADGHRFRGLLRALALHESFRVLAEPEGAGVAP